MAGNYVQWDQFDWTKPKTGTPNAAVAPPPQQGAPPPQAAPMPSVAPPAGPGGVEAPTASGAAPDPSINAQAISGLHAASGGGNPDPQTNFELGSPFYPKPGIGNRRFPSLSPVLAGLGRVY